MEFLTPQECGPDRDCFSVHVQVSVNVCVHSCFVLPSVMTKQH